MIEKTLGWAADVLQAPLLYGSIENDPQTQAIEFAGVSTDTRTLKPGNLYIPLTGARVDGHDYIEKAKEAGAAGALWNRSKTPYPEDLPLILTENTQDALGMLAAAYMKTLPCKVIGITGSNGKTSVKDMTAAILEQEFKTGKTQGNHNNEIGMPLTILSLDANTQRAVLEMGLEFPGDVSYLCSLCDLDAAIITSIGSAHMENFGSRKEIARHKCEILEGLRHGGVLIYDKDSPEIEEILQECPPAPGISALSFSQEKLADYEIQDLQFTRKGIRFTVPAIDSEPFTVPVLGAFQASNAAAAAAAALEAGASLGAVHKGLASVQLTPMRGQPYDFGKAVIIDDTYKSNPESAAAALQMMMSIPAAKHVAVLADMLDLGPEESALHQQTGQLAKDLGTDVLYTVGERGQWIADGFGQGAVHAADKEELVSLLEPLQNEDAVILIKGSRAMKMDEVVSGLLERETKNETC